MPRSDFGGNKEWWGWGLRVGIHFKASVAGKGIDNFQSRDRLTFSVMGGGAVSAYKRNSEKLQIQYSNDLSALKYPYFTS